MNVRDFTYQLFNRTVTFHLYEQTGADRFFFTMHDNETTSVRAGKQVIREQGGQLLELTHGGTRNIPVQFDGNTYVFDPNRMFSKHGVIRSLREQTETNEIPAPVTEAVCDFSAFVVDEFQFQEKPRIHTLHNTTDDLTVESYLEEGEFRQNASNVHVQPEQIETDFYLVTELDVFEWFRDRRWNVVLQDNENVDEDGSLSVWADDEGISYVNVEAGLGHVNTQKKMIYELYHL